MSESPSMRVSRLTRTTLGGLFLLFAGFQWLIPAVFLCRVRLLTSDGALSAFLLTLAAGSLSALAHLFGELWRRASGEDKNGSGPFFRRPLILLSLPTAFLAIFLTPALFGRGAFFWAPFFLALETACAVYIPPLADRLFSWCPEERFFTPREDVEKSKSFAVEPPVETLHPSDLSALSDSPDSAPSETLRFVAPAHQELDESAALAGFLPGLFSGPDAFDGEAGDGELDEELIEEEPSADQTGVLNRFDSDSGRERIEGWIRVRFDSTEEVSVAHLSFCPPFATRPELEIAQVSGPEVRITVTDVEPFGARVEVKRRRSEVREADDENEGVVAGSFIDDSVRLAFFAEG